MTDWSSTPAGRLASRARRALAEEHAPDAARDRVWRRMQRPPRCRSWSVPVALTAAAASALVWLLFDRASPAEGAPPAVHVADGEVAVTAIAGRPGAIWIEGPGHYRWVRPDRLEWTGDALLGAVAPGSGLTIDAGAYEVRIVGTRFDLTRFVGGLHVAVSEGSVELMGPDGRVRVEAGQAAASQRHPPLASMDFLEAEEPSLAPPSTRQMRSEQPVAAPTARRVSEHRSSAPPPNLPKPESAEDLIERAASAELDEALTLLERASRGEGPVAEFAVFSTAERLLRAGRMTEAERFFRRYLREFSGGHLEPEARMTLARLYMKTDRPRLALELMLGADDRPGVRRLQAEALRRVGRYAEAADAYAEIEGAEALAARAWCLARAGLVTEARAVMQDYLRRHPEGRDAADLRRILDRE